jgi:hypothetical protein
MCLGVESVVPQQATAEEQQPLDQLGGRFNLDRAKASQLGLEWKTMSRFTLAGTLTAALHPAPDDVSRATLRVCILEKGEDQTVMQVGVRATPKHGIHFQTCPFPEPSYSLEDAFYSSNDNLWAIQVFIGHDGLFFVSLRPPGGKWRSIGASMSDGMYRITQAADGLGFVRHSNQPEYWPPTMAVGVKFNLAQTTDRRVVPKDQRKVLQQAQWPDSQFKKSLPLKPPKAKRKTR